MALAHHLPSPDEEAQDNRVVPMRRPFVMGDHYFYEMPGLIAPTTIALLVVLERDTIGYQRTSVSFTLKALCERSDLSKPTVIKALAELEAANIITSDARYRGPTQVRTYTRVSPEFWHMQALRDARDARRSPALKTGQNILPTQEVGQEDCQVDVTGQKDCPTVADFGQNILPITPGIGQKSLPLINKERERKVGRKKTTTAGVADKPLTAAGEMAAATANATVTEIAVASVASVAPIAPIAPVSRAPKMSIAERDWRLKLLEIAASLQGVQKVPNHGQEWDAAGKFYRLRLTGHGEPDQPPSHDTIAACLQVELQRPAWDSRFLSLQVVLTKYAAYMRSPANYQRAIERSRQAANGLLQEDGMYPPRAAPPPSLMGRYGRAPNEPGPLQRADRVKWPKGWE